MGWSNPIPINFSDILTKSGNKKLSMRNTAAGNALLEGITGDSWQNKWTGKNLLYNYYSDPETYDGLTFTCVCANPNAKDLVIDHLIVNGTATDDTDYQFAIVDLNMISYRMSGCPSGGSTSTYMLQLTDDADTTDIGNGVTFTPTVEGSVKVNVVIKKGTVCNNLIFRPMITLASETDQSYEPYCGEITSPNPDYPQTIYSTGDMGWFDGEWIKGYLLSGNISASNNSTVTSNNYIPCKENDTITISYMSDTPSLKSSGSCMQIAFFNENKEAISSEFVSGPLKVGEITTPNNATSFRFTLYFDADIDISQVGHACVTINGKYALSITALGKDEILDTTFEKGCFDSTGAINTESSFGHSIIEIDSQYDYVLSNGYGSVSAPKHCWFDSGMQFISAMTLYKDMLLIPPSNAKYLGVSYPSGRVPTVQKHKTISIPLSEPLRGIGDVKDEICCRDGLWGVLRRIKEVVLDGSETWIHATGQNHYFHFKIGEYGYVVDNVVLSSHFSQRSIVMSNDNVGINAYNSSSYNNSRIAIRPGKDEIQDENDFKDWLTQNFIRVIHGFTTPIFEPFEDQTPFYSFESYNEITNISIPVSNENLQPTIEMSAPMNRDAAIAMMAYCNTKKMPTLDDVEELKKSVADGKELLAETISELAVMTMASDASFEQLNSGIQNVYTEGYRDGKIEGANETKVGTATAADVLTDKTFTNSSGVGLSGTMPNNGAWTESTTGQDNVTIPKGYHNGSGYVSGKGAYDAGYSKGVTDGTSTYPLVLFTSERVTGITDGQAITNFTYDNAYITNSGDGVYTCKKAGTYRFFCAGSLVGAPRCVIRNSSGTTKDTKAIADYNGQYFGEELAVDDTISFTFNETPGSSTYTCMLAVGAYYMY